MGDFDGDGRPDLLSGSHCCEPSAFQYFRRAEDGSWEPRVRMEATPGEKLWGISQRSQVAAADWNGDGTPDLLVRASFGRGVLVAPGPFRKGEPMLLAGSIDFHARRRTETPWGVQDFAVADWDRDGLPDFLARLDADGEASGLYWFKNLGGPGLTKLAEGRLLLSEARGEWLSGFCIADWNDDGRPDVIVSIDRLEKGPAPDDPGRWRASLLAHLRK